MNSERWRDILNYDGKYQVSNFGNVRSKKRILKLHINNWGYKSVSFLMDKKRKTYLIHRLVALHFISNVENKPNINHIDGNKFNNNVNNLEWVTQKENVNHANRIGLTKEVNEAKSIRMKSCSSEDSIRAILTQEQVLEIRRLYKKDGIVTQQQLADKYGVSRGHIASITRFKTWNKLKMGDKK